MFNHFRTEENIEEMFPCYYMYSNICMKFFYSSVLEYCASTLRMYPFFSFQEMLRFTGDNTLVSKELKAALDTMLGVLKHVNDIMHQVGITGFQVRNMFIVQHPMQFCGSCNKAPL